MFQMLEAQQRKGTVLRFSTDLRAAVLPSALNNGMISNCGKMWDDAMVEEHKGKWAETFAGWMQSIVASSETNAFSMFMHAETNRVLRDRVKGVLVVLGVTN